MTDSELEQKQRNVTSERIRNMTKFKVGEAALLVGKSPPTLGRAVKSGKISVTKDDDGDRLYDATELVRVYGSLNYDALVQESENDEVGQGEKVVHSVSSEKMKARTSEPDESDPAIQNLLLKQENKALKTRIDEKDVAHAEYRKMTEQSLLLLTHLKPDIDLTPEGKGGNFWRNIAALFVVVALAGTALYYQDNIVSTVAKFSAANDSTAAAVESEIPQG